MKFAVALALAVAAFPDVSYAQTKAIELPKLVEEFMVQSGSSPEWSMGAGASTPQIAWKSSGVEDRSHCGSYTSCRRGTTRVLVNGKEIQHLRQDEFNS